MERVGTQWIFSPSDLVGFAGCRRLTELEQLAGKGVIERPHRHDRGLEALVERGRVHEERHLSSLEKDRTTVTRIPLEWKSGPAGVVEAAKLTTEAMRRGDRVIHQATFFASGWRGHVDFLERVETPSALGDWSYEPADAKLARHAKPAAVLQLCAYSEQMAPIQGRLPERIHLILGGPVRPKESLRLSDYIWYYRWLKAEFLAASGATDLPADAAPYSDAAGIYPEPVEQCEICRWSGRCDKQRRADDHLSLVANIRRRQRDLLVGRGVDTVESLAKLPLPVEPPLERTSRSGIERVREQARIQMRGRAEGRVVHERLTGVQPGCGLGSLPELSVGDLFLDLEGDPFAGDDGLEYLFGVIEPGAEKVTDGGGRENAALTFHEFWAHDRTTEREAFERIVDLIRDRRARHPTLHVYHYGHYEVSAFKRLMCRHGTREDEVDEFLRAEVFVDLLRVVRQGIRASIESYSIKKLEPLYGFERTVPLSKAGDCRADFEAWLEMGATSDLAPGVREKVRLYNRDDCVSAYRLRDWLEGERAQHFADGMVMRRPVARDGAASEGVTKRAMEVDAVMSRLLAGVPEERIERSEEQQASWLLAQLLEWHRRTQKAEWWEFHRLCELKDDPEELINDASAIGGLTYLGIDRSIDRSHVHRYAFPEQDHGLRPGMEVSDPSTQKNVGDLITVDNDERFLEIKRGKKSGAPAMTALIPSVFRGGSAPQDALLRIGACFADSGVDARDRYGAAHDLLRRRPPNFGQAEGEPLYAPGDDLLAVALRFAHAMGGSQPIVLPIQGPPGSGKTFTAGRMIVALARRGKRVGITGPSHQVIKRVLEEVVKVAAQTPMPTLPLQIAKPHDLCAGVALAEDGAAVAQALASGTAHVVGATIWPWASPDLTGSLDVLFVDEAGQMSLANVIAASQAARSLVLLGDPQQLDQPAKGVHPPGADASALGHILDGAPTLDPTRGLFIDQTWRLHPNLCTFTSDLYYEGRLHARPELAAQHLDAPAPLGGAGLRVVRVAHQGNQNESPEEAAEVRRLFDQLLASRATWIDGGVWVTRQLGLSDILVIAPYNAHVNLLRRTLPAGARVGTVDKFQGQEAPVVIYSLASSSPDEAPRGMEFLYNPNRLNVATSRARCVALVVASPEVFAIACKTVRQLVLANGFCRMGMEPALDKI
jgi:predicted RecB family nuclease